MARNGDETGAGAAAEVGGSGWLGPLFEQLKMKLQAAADAVCAEETRDIAGVEKVARVVGVIARSAKAVDALRLRAEANSEEDEMGGRTYDPEEDERIRGELLVEQERIDRILEVKRSEADARRRAKAGAELASAAGPPDSSG